MKTYFIVCLLTLSGLFALSCNKQNPVEPKTNPPNIETNLSYNEACRDSVIAQVSFGVVIFHKSGSGLRKIVSNIDTRSISWTPNKWKILYSTPYDLYTMDPDGTNRQKISTHREYILYAISSPNGNKIGYVAIDTTDISLSRGWIKVMNADGTDISTLTPLQPIPNHVTWTPDSKEIIYNGGEGINVGIFAVSIDSKNIRSLYTAPYGLSCFPSLSCDGSTLAISTSNDTTNKIILLDMKSGQIRQLTTGDSFDSEPSWSADGRLIVYSRGEFVSHYSWSGSSIWSIEPDGQNNARLTPFGPDHYGPCLQK